jgi:protein-L-isoaspartate(D-aspartate) O-methyltransferase
MDPTAAAREQLVERTIVRRGVRDPDVLRAMRTVPRHLFVPDDVRHLAYEDEPLPIGLEQTISQPYVVAWMAELARVRPGARVLDVGTGSGYQAAVLRAIGAEVWSIEIVPELHERARRALAEAGIEGVRLRLGDGRLGWPEAAPFDAILVAAAAEHVPPALMDQLADGGRLVVPVGTRWQQELLLLEKTDWGGLRRHTYGEVAFVPLV